MLTRHASLRVLGCAIVAGTFLLAPMAWAEPDSAADAQPGTWVAHKYTFNFMGFTTTYSCEGLEDKLRLLLQINGAGPDKKAVQVNSPCTNAFGGPDKLAFAYLTFSSLLPQAAQGDATSGQWKHVELSPRHPFELGEGDCELIEEFRDRVLPMFTTRNIKNNVFCVPHQSVGSSFFLSYDVFVPPAPAKSPRGT